MANLFPKLAPPPQHQMRVLLALFKSMIYRHTHDCRRINPDFPPCPDVHYIPVAAQVDVPDVTMQHADDLEHEPFVPNDRNDCEPSAPNAPKLHISDKL